MSSSLNMMASLLFVLYKLEIDDDPFCPLQTIKLIFNRINEKKDTKSKCLYNIHSYFFYVSCVEERSLNGIAKGAFKLGVVKPKTK